MGDALDMNRNPFDIEMEKNIPSVIIDTGKAPIPSKFIPKSYKATVVSLIPWQMFPEEKPHLQPSTYKIPIAPKDGISVFHVGEAGYNVANPFDDTNIRVPVTPDEIARSIVEDYVSAQICLDEGACPGIFWVQGELTVEDVMQYYPEKVAEYRLKQTNWFKLLVGMADADFTKNKNILAISDIQRHAARSLGIKKDWVDFSVLGQDLEYCPFCKSIVPIGAVVCNVCREVINREAYNKLKGEVVNG